MRTVKACAKCKHFQAQARAEYRMDGSLHSVFYPYCQCKLDNPKRNDHIDILFEYVVLERYNNRELPKECPMEFEQNQLTQCFTSGMVPKKSYPISVLSELDRELMQKYFLDEALPESVDFSKELSERKDVDDWIKMGIERNGCIDVREAWGGR
jgi:hypothetical protein